MALRTFVGSCATLTSSVVNLTILMILKGEPGWICLMCCNADSKLRAPHTQFRVAPPPTPPSNPVMSSAVLFSVLVLHWVTSFDRTTTDSSYARDRENRNDGSGNTANPPSRNMTNGTLTNGQPLDPNDPAAKGGPRNSMRQHSQSPARNQSGWDAKATIRTQCSAGNEQPNPDEIALDRIVVKTERILEIESDGRSDRSDTTTGRDFGPRDCSSTDGIVDQV